MMTIKKSVKGLWMPIKVMNKLLIKKFLEKINSRVGLKDLVFHLKEIKTMSCDKKVLFKAYTEMTSENK